MQLAASLADGCFQIHFLWDVFSLQMKAGDFLIKSTLAAAAVVDPRGRLRPSLIPDYLGDVSSLIFSELRRAMKRSRSPCVYVIDPDM